MEDDPPKKDLKSEQKWLRGQLLHARIQRQPERRQYTIFKVPRSIRECDEMAYTPRQVTIGFNNAPGDRPGHFDWYKWRCVRYLLARHRNQDLANKLLDQCLDEMRKLEGWLMRRYADSGGGYITGPSIIMDGCFILHLLLREQHRDLGKLVDVVVVGDNSNKKPGGAESATTKARVANAEDQLWPLEFDEGEENKEPLIDVPFIWSQLKYDLLMLENQFPFLIIQKLFDVLKTPEDENVDLVELALKFFQDLHPLKPKTKPNLSCDQIHHLLHLFHESLKPPNLADVPIPTPSSALEWIPSAIELQEAGVKFKKKKGDNIFKITFDKGVLEVPPFPISTDANIIFRNLMAFEQCFPVTPYVTAYALFMNCIAHTANDARLLHQNRIAQNATDEQVAGFFDRLCSKIQYPGGTNYLLPVYIQVGQYYESKWHKWRANLLNEYFSTPWVTASVVAATILLILTVMQTYYTAYSYYHPSS